MNKATELTRYKVLRELDEAAKNWIHDPCFHDLAIEAVPKALSALALYMKAVDEAPHPASCKKWVLNPMGPGKRLSEDVTCTCWKAELESQVKALLEGKEVPG